MARQARQVSTRTLADVIVEGANDVLHRRPPSVYCPGADPYPTTEQWRIYRHDNGRLFVTIDTPTHAVITAIDIEGL